MSKWVGILAGATPVLQVLLMGVIGYPLARRRPGGLAAFHRSGFTWWLITLGVVVVLGVALAPDLLQPADPSGHQLTVARVIVAGAAGLVAVLAIELLGSALDARSRSPRAARDRRQYESVLPRWAQDGRAESGLIAGMAVVEEVVYRGLALGALVLAWQLPEAVAVGAVSIAFGAAHWYFGPRQVLLKILVGAVLCGVALGAGWVVAAAVHVAVNLILAALSRRKSPLVRTGQ